VPSLTRFSVVQDNDARTAAPIPSPPAHPHLAMMVQMTDIPLAALGIPPTAHSGGTGIDTAASHDATTARASRSAIVTSTGWQQDTPCFGCLLAEVTGSTTPCTSAAPTPCSPKKPAPSSKSPGRGLCRLWDTQPPLAVHVPLTYVMRGAPFSGHNYSQMFRKFSGLRAYHELRCVGRADSEDASVHGSRSPGRSQWQPTPTTVDRSAHWLILVFHGDVERDMWLAKDGICQRVKVHDLLPFSLWAAQHGAEYGLSLTAPCSEGTRTPSRNPNPCPEDASTAAPGPGLQQERPSAVVSACGASPLPAESSHLDAAAPLAVETKVAHVDDHGVPWSTLHALVDDTLWWRPCFVKRETKGACSRRGVMCPAFRFSSRHPTVCVDHHPLPTTVPSAKHQRPLEASGSTTQAVRLHGALPDGVDSVASSMPQYDATASAEAWRLRWQQRELSQLAHHSDSTTMPSCNLSRRGAPRVIDATEGEHTYAITH
jgi:hypothetical protein